MPAETSRFRLTLAILSIAIIIAAIAGATATEAQHPDVDIAVSIEREGGNQSSAINVEARNLGADTAYDVVILIKLYASHTVTGFVSPTAPTLTHYQNDPYTLQWRIPELPGYAFTTLDDQIIAKVGRDDPLLARFTVTLESPQEEEIKQHNNQAEFFISRGFTSRRKTSLRYGQATPDYGIAASIKESSETKATFAIVFDVAGQGRAEENTLDTLINISIPRGLKVVKTTPNHEIMSPPGFRTVEVTDEGQLVLWNLGFVEVLDQPTGGYELLIETERAGTLTPGQCLTAEVTALPPAIPNREGYDDPSNNTAEVCLDSIEAEDQKIIVADGPVDLLNLYDCVGPTDAPCRVTGSVILATAEGNTIYQPENVIVHIPDPTGRSDNTSWRWRTGNDHDNDSTSVGFLPGVAAKFVPASATFQTHNLAIADATPSPGGNPSNMRMVWADNPIFTLLDIEDQPTYELDFSSLPAWRLLFEFSDLGTYHAEITAGGNHKPTGVHYQDSAVYTFHVGPIADLEVRDGGPSADAPPDEPALSIVAVNNGPNHAPDARVSGLPKGAQVVSITQGEYDPDNGVWRIGEMKHPDWLFTMGQPPYAELVLADNGGAATVTIANHKDYTVCIESDGRDVPARDETACDAVGASWHSGSVYDYRDRNNAVTIPSRAGSKGTVFALDPAEEASLWVDGKTDTEIILKMTGPDSLFLNPVDGYMVVVCKDDDSTAENECRDGDEFTNWTLAARVDLGREAVAEYVHRGLMAGDTRYYRAYAENAIGRSPSSSLVRGATLGYARDPESPHLLAAQAGAGVKLDWLLYHQIFNYGEVNRYEVRVSHDAGESWDVVHHVTPLDCQDEATCVVWYDTGFYEWTHENQGPVAGRQYRIRAYSTYHPGQYSDSIPATVKEPPPAQGMSDGQGWGYGENEYPFTTTGPRTVQVDVEVYGEGAVRAVLLERSEDGDEELVWASGEGEFAAFTHDLPWPGDYFLRVEPASQPHSVTITQTPLGAVEPPPAPVPGPPAPVGDTPPVADAGPDIEGKRGGEMVLAGAGVANPEGSQALSYQWSIAGASHGELAGLNPSVWLSDADQATATFLLPRRRDMTDEAALDDGNWIEFRLTVSDGDGESSTDFARMTIQGTTWTPDGE